MLLNKVRTALLGGGLACLVGWMPVQAETLGDALVAAYRNSNLLDQNRALLRAADEGVAQSVATMRPVIDFVLKGTHTNSERVSLTGGGRSSPDTLTSSAAVTASINLYDGGNSRMGIEAARETVLATRQGLVGVESNVLLTAVEAWTNLRLYQDIVALRQGNVRVLERELQASRDRFELGEITRTDVAQAEAALAGARADLASAEGNVLVGRETYKLATGNAPTGLPSPPRPPQTASSVEEARRIARSHHHAIRQLQHELTAAEINVKRAAARMGPSLGLSASAGQNNQGLTDRSVSLTLSQTIYQGGGLSSAYRQAMAQRDAVRASLNQQVAVVEQSVGAAWAQRQVTRASIEATDRQIVAARAAYEGVREEARLGARTTLDVLNAEQQLLDAQAQRLQAVTSEYVSNYQLLSAMGHLTVDHLKLGIPTYDVTGYYNAVKNAPVTSPQGKRLDRIMETVGRR